MFELRYSLKISVEKTDESIDVLDLDDRIEMDLPFDEWLMKQRTPSETLQAKKLLEKNDFDEAIRIYGLSDNQEGIRDAVDQGMDHYLRTGEPQKAAELGEKHYPELSRMIYVELAMFEDADRVSRPMNDGQEDGLVKYARRLFDESSELQHPVLIGEKLIKGNMKIMGSLMKSGRYNEHDFQHDRGWLEYCPRRK